jgi:hypothetical protein
MAMASTLSYLPTDLIQGESINKTLSSVTTVTGYTLAYKFSSQPIPITVSCVGTTGTWVLTVTGDQTVLWKRGIVRYAAYLTNSTSGAVTVIDSGEITVEASPMATSQYTAILTACESALASYASNPNSSISVGTIRIDYKDEAELTKLIDYYKREIAKETGNGYGGGRVVLLTRFN